MSNPQPKDRKELRTPRDRGPEKQARCSHISATKNSCGTFCNACGARL